MYFKLAREEDGGLVHQRNYSTPSRVSTGMGNHSRVYYLGIYSAVRANSAWPFLSTTTPPPPPTPQGAMSLKTTSAITCFHSSLS